MHYSDMYLWDTETRGWDIPDFVRSGPEDLVATDFVYICELLEEGYTDREIGYNLNIDDRLIDMVRRKIIGAEFSDKYDYPIIINYTYMVERAREAVHESDGALSATDLEEIVGIPRRIAARILFECFPQGRLAPEDP